MRTSVLAVIVGVCAVAVLLISFLVSQSTPQRKATAQVNTFFDDQFLADLKAGDLDRAKSDLQHEPNLNAIDKNDDTPIKLVLQKIDDLQHYRARTEHPVEDWQALAEEMVKRGADINLHGPTSSPPISNVRSQWSVEFLLNHGANINPPNNSPLALMNDYDISIAELLIKKGADPNAKVFEGQTPLHHAAASNNVGMIQLLLDHGAKINTRDDKGYTPLKRAKLSLQREATELLTSKGGVE
jgi:ankyrin repeat protein